MCKIFHKIELRHTKRTQNELGDALSTISSTIKHSDTDHIDFLDIELKEPLVHCSHVEVEPNGFPWYFNIKKYLEMRSYPKDNTSNQKRSIHRKSLKFFLSGEMLYRRYPDLDLLKCVDAVGVSNLIDQIRDGVCGTNMNGLTLERKILCAGYFWMSIEHYYCKCVHKCNKCQVHGDLILVPPHELNAMSSPWAFVSWHGCHRSN